MKRRIFGSGVLFSFLIISGCALQGPTSSFLPIDDIPATSSILKERRIGNSVQVSTYNLPPVRLGECVTLHGETTGKACLKLEFPIDLTGDKLNKENFKLYSAVTDIDASASGGAGTASGEVKEVFSKNTLVMEWRRYRTLQVPLLASGDSTGPFVSSVDIGIAVRVIFNVKTNSASAKAAANFGVSDMLAALATHKAQVEVMYDTVGLKGSILPNNPFNMNSVEDFIKAQNTFYDAVKVVSESWTKYTKDAVMPDGALVADGTVVADGAMPVARLSSLNKPAGFDFGIISYTASNLPDPNITTNASYSGGYLKGLMSIKTGISCDKAQNNLSKSIQQDSIFMNGFLKAYKDVLIISECNDVSPNSIQQATSDMALKTYSSSSI